MHGNVEERCEGWYGDYPTGATTDPQGPSSGSYRVARGGSWHYFAVDCRSVDRNYGGAGIRSSYLGFRLVRK